MNKTLVIVNHTGSCNGEYFVKDVEVELSDVTLATLGRDSYILASEKDVEKKSVKEEAAPKEEPLKSADQPKVEESKEESKPVEGDKVK